MPFLRVIPRLASSFSRALLGAGRQEPGGEHQAVVGEGGGGGAVRGAGGAERGHDVRAGHGDVRGQREGVREWSSIQARISASCPPASGQWVKSDCHSSLGCSAAKRIHDERGRLRGCGVTSPARAR